MLYKILIRKSHSLASGMTPYWPLLTWRQFSTSNYNKLRSPTPQPVLPRVFQRRCLAESSNPILDSPMPISRQTRSQTIIHTQDIPNVPLPPRVVTPRTLRPSPPRVPTRSRRLSPCNLSQNYCGMDTAHMAIALGDNHWSRQHQANAVIQPVTGKEME
jgi:hypothetical protein